MIHEPILASGASSTTVSVLTALLEARTGQQMAAYRSWRIDTALKPLLRDRGFDSLDRLVQLLLDGTEPTIGDAIVDALLNQETSFFRDAQVFDLIVEAVAAVEGTGRVPRIWCAGCSTGQEPLSLAMVFAERAEDTGKRAPEIVATDVSPAAITRAKTGRYTQFEIQRGLPIRRMMRWFDSEGADWTAKPVLTGAVRYSRHNLVGGRPPPGRFDIVLCRNVLLYLAPETKATAFAGIAAAMNPGGTLALGAGETVIGQTRAFTPSKTHRGLYTHTG
ncbi:protein-glutamate O-methyltransferase CheR [Sphingomonas bacterium]|uniref:CheR family methyltransferase n=1 Tax=Sphingomonas bacterium TaxID=1895847 RepID=UPI0015766661|nr:protein-glutamate O-methyltransferase CheR [Sphingomonas bacterium]